MNPTPHATSLGRLEDLPADYLAALATLSVAPLWPQLRGLLPRGMPARHALPHAWRDADTGPRRPEWNSVGRRRSNLWR